MRQLLANDLSHRDKYRLSLDVSDQRIVDQGLVIAAPCGFDHPAEMVGRSPTPQDWRRLRESGDPVAFVTKTLDSRFRGNDDVALAQECRGCTCAGMPRLRLRGNDDVAMNASPAYW